jgi:cell division protein FtsQ
MTTTGTRTPEETESPRARINPRIRERRIEVQREAGRRRLRVLLVGASVRCAAGISVLVGTSPVLDVDHMSVTGMQHVTAAQVRTASGVSMHDHLLFVDAGAAAHRVEQLPWVAHASVKRDFPGTLKIAITEYIPVAYVRGTTGVVLVAENGHVIAYSPTAPTRGVEIRGVRRAPSVGELLSPPDAAGVVSRLPATLAPQVSAVDVSGGGLALVLARGGQIRMGNASDLDAKAAAAEAVLAHLGAQSFSYVDVSTPNRPVSHT